MSGRHGAVGSNSNAVEKGIAAEADRASIWEVDAASGRHHVSASGMRDPVGMAWEPERGALWVAVNERDELGSDLVPDYMTAVGDGASRPHGVDRAGDSLGAAAR